MAYNHYRQPYASAPSPDPDIHLKPVFNTTSASLHYGASNEYYKPVPQNAPAVDADVARLESKDQRLKNRIRVLRLVSRVLSTVLAGATLAPLTMTIVKFFETRNVFYTVNGKQRTAWAANTQTWFTFLYFGVALVSFLANLVVVLAYCRGVRAANATAKTTGLWDKFLMVADIVAWVVSAVIYRIGKEPVDGKFKDLWGWTCSTAANELQNVIGDINFAKYCTIQTASFYSGIANVVTHLIAAAIYIMMALRLRSRSKLRKQARRRVGDAREPLRQ